MAPEVVKRKDTDIIRLMPLSLRSSKLKTIWATEMALVCLN